MKTVKILLIAAALILLVAVLIVSCDAKEMYKYYADRDNYIRVTGTVSHVCPSEEFDALVIAFADMSVKLSDNNFKIVGGNWDIVQNYDEIQIGDRLEFVTAPRYFGDGYVMPIVSLKKDETTLLEFEVGVENLLNWLASK